MQNQSVLVTGGAGFIGSELVRQLSQQDFRVRVVDNLVTGKRENLDDMPGERVELIVADVRDKDLMISLSRGMGIIFHLGCLGARHSIHSPVENHEVNASATLGLLNAARHNGVRRFVYVSSSEVYGTAKTVPITEEHATVPLTVYGASKLAGESYARAFWETYRYPTVVLRPFNAYGPRCHHEGDSGEIIPKFMLRCMAGKPMVILGSGTQTRDFTYVSDIAGAIRAAGLSDDCVGQTLNLGSGKEIEIRELAAKVASVLNRPDAKVTHVESHPGEVLRLLAESSKARRLLGFQPNVPLHDGLTRLRDWYAGQERSPEELLEQEIIRNWAPRDVASHV